MSYAMATKLMKADLGLLLSLWFPYADATTLQALTYFTCWMFLVDDETDKVSAPGLDNKEGFRALHE